MFRISSFEFRVLSTPGHTPGSSCFYFEKEKALFTGDTLFKDAIGAYDHKYSSKEDLFDSIRAKLFILPDETIIYPGHGDSSTIVRVRSSVDLPRLA